MNQIDKLLEELIERYKQLKPIKADIYKAFEILKTAYNNGNKMLVAGNGGSCADAEHIVGELMKGFVKQRKLSEEMQKKLIETDEKLGEELAEKLQGALPAIAVTGHQALSTAYLNDVDAALTYAQQVNGYGDVGDVFLGISTSGTSKNILYAATVAKAKGMKVIALSGGDGGKLKAYADINIIVPEIETYKIQELHLPIYHVLCLMLEEYFF